MCDRYSLYCLRSYLASETIFWPKRSCKLMALTIARHVPEGVSYSLVTLKSEAMGSM
jgi:hypothetical protein